MRRRIHPLPLPSRSSICIGRAHGRTLRMGNMIYEKSSEIFRRAGARMARDITIALSFIILCLALVAAQWLDRGF